MLRFYVIKTVFFYLLLFFFFFFYLTSCIDLVDNIANVIRHSPILAITKSKGMCSRFQNIISTSIVCFWEPNHDTLARPAMRSCMTACRWFNVNVIRYIVKKMMNFSNVLIPYYINDICYDRARVMKYSVYIIFYDSIFNS